MRVRVPFRGTECPGRGHAGGCAAPAQCDVGGPSSLLWGLGSTLTWPWVWEVAWLVLQRVPAAWHLCPALEG